MKKRIFAPIIILACTILCSCSMQKTVTRVITPEDDQTPSIPVLNVSSQSLQARRYLGISPDGNLIFRKSAAGQNNSSVIDTVTTEQPDGQKVLKTYPLTENVFDCMLIDGGRSVIFCTERYDVKNVCLLNLESGEVETLGYYNTATINGYSGQYVFSEPDSTLIDIVTIKDNDTLNLDTIDAEHKVEYESELFSGLSNYIAENNITRIFRLSNNNICVEYKTGSIYTVADVTRMVKLCESTKPTCGTDKLFYIDTEYKLVMMEVHEEESICYTLAEDVNNFAVSGDQTRIAYTVSSVGNGAEKLFVSDVFGKNRTALDAANSYTSLSMNSDGTSLVAALPAANTGSTLRSETTLMTYTLASSDADSEN